MELIINFISTYFIVLLILWLIPIIFFCCWYGNTRKIKNYISILNENLIEHSNNITQQNMTIIENQNKIIELLEKQNANTNI